MRCLFATSRSDDYISACAWDGLQQLLGEKNVSDASFCPYLHNYTGPGGSSWRVGGHREGPCVSHADGRSYDLLVLNAAFLRDWDWGWPIFLRDTYLKSSGKICLIEGGDGHNEVNGPDIPVDAIFRREMRPDFTYPHVHKTHHLTFSAPERWLCYLPAHRGYDVFAAFAYQSNELRWPTLQRMFQTARPHLSIAASGSISYDLYFHLLQQSKLALCPPGGAYSDCMRFAEVTASGAIPVFIGLPPKIRHEWYTEEEAFFCTPETLPALLDAALATDLTDKRLKMLERTRKHFTTLAMAKRILSVLGLS